MRPLTKLLLFGLLLLARPSSATHIVGGGFDLQWISGSTYRLTLVVYRDCTSLTGFNDVLYVGVFDKVTNSMVDSFGMVLGTTGKINPAFAQCTNEVPGCTEKAVYTRLIDLPQSVYNNTKGYYISWERCCRNGIIQNIINPRDASMTFYAEIPSPAKYINSTPKLAVNPFTVLCIDNLFTYNISFTDADKDSLVYELITPINGTLTSMDPNDGSRGPILNEGPYAPVVWGFGYSTAAEISGNPPLSINQKNGQIRIKPNQTGVYVVGMRVTEYRNGVAIGLVHLELQFNVVNCVANSFPTVQVFQNGSAVSTDTLYVTVPDEITFGLTAYDADGIDSVIIESPLDSSELDYLTYSFNGSGTTRNYNWKWKTHCELHNKSLNKFVVTVTDKGCPIPKTIEANFYVKVLPMPVHPSTDVLCIELRNLKSSIVYFGDSARNKPYFKQYNIYRADGDTNFRLIDSIADRTALSYNDPNTPSYDKINYRYLIRGENVCGYEGATSDTLGSFDQLKYLPDKQYMYNVTVQDEQVLITWNQSRELDFARYFLWKGYRNQPLADYVMELDFTKKTDTVYLDRKVQVNDTSHCYYLVMLDTCGNYGPIGEVFCTTLLRGKSRYYENTLDWQKFVQTDESLVQYDLHKYAAYSSPEQLNVGVYDEATFSAKDVSFDTDDGRYVYEVDVLHKPIGWGATVVRSRSNKVALSQKPYLYVPNAFSPNNDGYNDTWFINDVFVKDYQLKVYDRWGKLVFMSDEKNRKWDGRDAGGTAVPEGVYVYLVTFTGWEGEVKSESGNVTLFR